MVASRSAGRDGRGNRASADVASPSSAALLSQLPRLKPGAAVVNLAGILSEQPPLNTFENVHLEGARRVAEYARAAGARLVHLSAILPPGAHGDPDLKYAGSKGWHQRRAHVTGAFTGAVEGRSTDHIASPVSRFNRMASFLPFLPVFGGGRTRFQPVYVNDLANAIVKVTDGEWERCKGKIIEAGGP
ncbi:MAG: hypothetical protein BJ554DRAFT_762, partial [Olpidium bornovanus]